MISIAATSALLLAGFVAAQDQTVNVGATGSNPFVYTPASITATNGSVITFVFSGSPGNHTVTQSTFADPCDPMSNGFDSGWVFIPPTTTGGFPSWNLTITDDAKPIWYYCKQLAPGPHCNSGMVGAINAPSTGNTFDSFQKTAEAHQGASGQGEGLLVGNGAAASAGPGPLAGSIVAVGVPTGTAATASGTPTSPSSGSSSGSGSAAPAPSGSGSSSGSAAPAKSSSAALSTGASALTAFAAAMFGIVLA